MNNETELKLEAGVFASMQHVGIEKILVPGSDECWWWHDCPIELGGVQLVRIPCPVLDELPVKAIADNVSMDEDSFLDNMYREELLEEYGDYLVLLPSWVFKSQRGKYHEVLEERGGFAYRVGDLDHDCCDFVSLLSYCLKCKSPQRHMSLGLGYDMKQHEGVYYFRCIECYLDVEKRTRMIRRFVCIPCNYRFVKLNPDRRVPKSVPCPRCGRPCRIGDDNLQKIVSQKILEKKNEEQKNEKQPSVAESKPIVCLDNYM